MILPGNHASRGSWGTRRPNPDHRSGPISSLFVAAYVADNVGHVLVAFLIVGDEGRIVIIIVLDGLVDFDIVFRFRDDGLHLAGVFLGIGFLERHQLFGFRRLRLGLGRHGRGGSSGATTGARWRYRRDRHDFAGIGGDDGALVEVVKFLARGRANAFGSEIGFGHGGILEMSEKRCFTWLVATPLSIAVYAHLWPA